MTVTDNWINSLLSNVLIKFIHWTLSKFKIELKRKLVQIRPVRPGGTSILGGRGGGGLGPKFCLWNSCWKPKFCLQKYKWQLLQILPSEFQIWPQAWDFSPTFVSCGDRIFKFFLLFREHGRTLPQNLPPNLMWGPSQPDLVIWKYPPLGLYASDPKLMMTSQFFQSRGSRIIKRRKEKVKLCFSESWPS